MIGVGAGIVVGFVILVLFGIYFANTATKIKRVEVPATAYTNDPLVRAENRLTQALTKQKRRIQKTLRELRT